MNRASFFGFPSRTRHALVCFPCDVRTGRRRAALHPAAQGHAQHKPTRLLCSVNGPLVCDRSLNKLASSARRILNRVGSSAVYLSEEDARSAGDSDERVRVPRCRSGGGTLPSNARLHRLLGNHVKTAFSNVHDVKDAVTCGSVRAW